MTMDCIAARSSAVPLPYGAVQSLVVPAQDQPLALRDIIQAHGELHQHSVQYLERIQHAAGVAPAYHFPPPFSLLAAASLSHSALRYC
jgi:hypothetical protein